jgi:hypothetical protein
MSPGGLPLLEQYSWLYILANDRLNQVEGQGKPGKNEKWLITHGSSPLAIEQHHRTQQVQDNPEGLKTHPRVERIDGVPAAVQSLIAERIERVDPILGNASHQSSIKFSCEALISVTL